MVTAAIEHIVLDDRGIAYIAGTRMKVMYIIMEKLANDWTPDEIVAQHPGILTQAQVYAAFSFYYDHQTEIDQQIKADFEFAERMRLEAEETAGKSKLRKLGLL